MEGRPEVASAGHPTRRDVLKMIEVGGLASGAAGVLGALGVDDVWAAPEKPVRLEFWDMQWGLANYNQVGAKLIQTWNRSHPHIHVEYTPTSWTNYFQKFATAISSGTNPDLASGGAYQPFQYLQQGFGSNADAVMSSLRTSGALSDFYPSSVNWMKYRGHYAALPCNIDLRAVYYRKSLLEKVDAAPPRTWDDLLSFGRALKKIGVFGFGMSGTTADAGGWQIVLCMMINNGGGFFAKDGTIHCVTDANIQTVEFLQQLAREKIIDPAAPGYIESDIYRQFGAGQLGLTWSETNMPNTSLPAAAAQDTAVVTDPIVSPRGTKGGFVAINPLMIFKHQSGAQLKATHQFLTWYAGHMAQYWEQNAEAAVPVRKSTAKLTPVVDNPFISVPTKNWLEYGYGTGHLYPHIVPDLNTVESDPAIYNFTESIVTNAKTPARTLLSTVENDLKTALGKDRLG